ncbi:MAG: purine nucleosidase [Cellvibrionaceae bacterium]|jgi:purine nucleosidase
MHRLIIDTDPGEDDALAIMMAAAHPNAIIEAITVAAGNVGLDYTANNAAVIVDILGLDIPIYPGCKHALVQSSHDASDAHGQDGLGDTGFRSDRPMQTTHGSIELVRRANAEPGELTLVTLGPLTNIAVALHLDPDLPHKIKRMVAMAGAVTARGNTNACTEFNVFADPEAAHFVFEAWAAAGKMIEVADWELTTRNGFTKEDRARWAALKSPKSDFYAAISAHSNRFIEEERGRTVNFFADPVAMAVALEPEIVTKCEQHHLGVEMTGGISRGQTIVDWLDATGRPCNADIVMEIDYKRLLELATMAQR